ncbi:MAG: hypothetical protein BWY71_01475 [Planctomycetes bacterium ADurb.Bin412]|nr:MAG: hypothetical protein BWY71_01475 [Planctomycetes bacterium ADurb.Bin412]
MFFHAGSLNLAVHAIGKDVVADGVFPAVVLVVVAGFGVIDEVVLHDDVGGALIVVKAPAAAAIEVVGIDVMDTVVIDGGALGQSQGIDAAHVAEDTPADVVDMVEVDMVVDGNGRGVAPGPADGNSGIIKVADIVVGNLVVAAVADPDTNRAMVEAGAAVDDAVVHGDVVGLFGRLPDNPLAHFDAAGTEIVEEGPGDGAVPAAAAEPHAINADMTDFAILERYIPGAVQHDGGGDGYFRLPVAVAAGR